MSLYNGPPRGGARGGRDQFSWDAVKADKDREYYLGHSVKALTGRWQKGKDVYWYTREKDDGTDKLTDELRAVKEKEEQLMAEALGIKPKSAPAQKRKLEEHEMQQLLHRSGKDTAEDDEGAEGGEHIKGLGYAPRAMGGVAGSAVLHGYDELGPAGPSRHSQHEDGPRHIEELQSHKRPRISDKSSPVSEQEKRSEKRKHKHKDKDKKHKDKKRKKEKKEKREKHDKR